MYYGFYLTKQNLKNNQCEILNDFVEKFLSDVNLLFTKNISKEEYFIGLSLINNTKENIYDTLRNPLLPVIKEEDLIEIESCFEVYQNNNEIVDLLADLVYAFSNQTLISCFDYNLIVKSCDYLIFNYKAEKYKLGTFEKIKLDLQSKFENKNSQDDIEQIDKHTTNLFSKILFNYIEFNKENEEGYEYEKGLLKAKELITSFI